MIFSYCLSAKSRTILLLNTCFKPLVMPNAVFTKLQDARKTGRKLFALLIDPDHLRLQNLDQTVALLNRTPVDLVMVGGSLLLDERLEECLSYLRARVELPILLFPGSALQITSKADAILLLSLISGRNPELLIGQHVTAAPYLRSSGLEIIPTGYMLIDGGRPTTASYVSHTLPIPANKPDIAICTAMAGEMLGLRCLYLDAGSGAHHPVSPEMIRRVRENTQTPLIVGGGIRTGEQLHERLAAGADMVVIGHAVEEEPQRLMELSGVVNRFNAQITRKTV